MARWIGKTSDTLKAHIKLIVASFVLGLVAFVVAYEVTRRARQEKKESPLLEALENERQAVDFIREINRMNRKYREMIDGKNRETPMSVTQPKEPEKDSEDRGPPCPGE